MLWNYNDCSRLIDVRTLHRKLYDIIINMILEPVFIPVSVETACSIYTGINQSHVSNTNILAVEFLLYFINGIRAVALKFRPIGRLHTSCV